MADPVVVVNDLRKAYDGTVVVSDVSFQVAAGEIFCIVGPNGAGKTTTVECVEGQRKPDGGSISVLGLDPHAERGNELRQRIGVQLQEANLPDRLKVWEAMDLFSSFYDRTLEYNTLIDRLGLEDKRNTVFVKLSGGQKQRLFVALALLNDPDVVFLDELTTGLDPHARKAIWAMIREIRDQGKTIVLTTHFMDEAEQLGDRVAIMHGGNIVAADTPERLIESADLDVQIHAHVTREPVGAGLEALRKRYRVTVETKLVTVAGRGAGLVGAVVRAVEDGGSDVLDLRIRRPSLEDVFLATTEAGPVKP